MLLCRPARVWLKAVEDFEAGGNNRKSAGDVGDKRLPNSVAEQR